MSGFGMPADWNGTVAFAASRGVPKVLLAEATALELLGAISLLAGFRTRWGVVALVVFLVPATLVFHNFWAAQGLELQQELTQFLKNVAIGGGLFIAFAAGPGALSVDSRSTKAKGRERRGAEMARASSRSSTIQAGGGR